MVRYLLARRIINLTANSIVRPRLPTQLRQFGATTCALCKQGSSGSSGDDDDSKKQSLGDDSSVPAEDDVLSVRKGQPKPSGRRQPERISEAEALEKLLRSSFFTGEKSAAPSPAKAPANVARKKQNEPDDVVADRQSNAKALFGPEIDQSVEDVSEEISKSGKKDKKDAKDDILLKLTEIESQTERRARGGIPPVKSEAEALRKLFNLPPLESQGEPSEHIADTLRSMIIDKSPSSGSRGRMRRDEQPTQFDRRERGAPAPSRGREDRGRPVSSDRLPVVAIDLFEGERLGIFEPIDASKFAEAHEKQFYIWDALEKDCVRRKYTMAPRNGFEEMIQWTEQGKLWPYPIDNDYQRDDENNVEFHEHVFLDPFLEPFPPGPIRQFMELIINALSKNAFIPVSLKHEHIAWFRQYFEEMGAEITKLHELETRELSGAA